MGYRFSLKIWLLCTLIFSVGCVTVDSARHEDRMRALDGVKDQNTLGGYVENAKYEDVRDAAINRITNPVILLRIAKKRPVKKEIRAKAINRLSSDDDLLEVVSTGDLEMDLRLQAARKLSSDLTKSKAASISELPIFERKALISSLLDEGILSDITLKNTLPAELRVTASQKVLNEAVLLRFLFDSSIPSADRNKTAIRLNTADTCEKALLAEDLYESTQQKLVEQLLDEDAKMRVISLNPVATSARCSLVGRLSNLDNVVDVVLNGNLPEVIREKAADVLKDRKDESRLVAVFRKSKDLAGVVLATKRIADSSLPSKENQDKLIEWFKRAEASNMGDTKYAMDSLCRKMMTDSSLWYVAEESRTATSAMRELCLAKVSDKNLLVQAACRKGDGVRIRKVALGKLKDDIKAVRRVFNESKDASGAILALELLPDEDVKQPSAQQKLAIWLSTLSEDGDELELSVKILKMLAPEAEIDGAEVQMKIARVLAAYDTEDLRVIVRKLLVDPNSIEALVTEKFGNNPKLAVWAVDLIVGDVELEKAVYRAKTTMAQCRALSRIASEKIVAALAKAPQVDSIVRYLAVGRLGPGCVDLLERLAKDSDPVLAAGAIKALTIADTEKAKSISAEREKRLQKKKEERQSYLQTREALDNEEAKREYEKNKAVFQRELSMKYANIDVLKEIRKCRAWGQFNRSGVNVGNRKVSFIGYVSSYRTITHWFSKDEMEMDIKVDVEGDSYKIHLRTIESGGFSNGNRVRISGWFRSGDDNEMTLSNMTLSHIR